MELTSAFQLIPEQSTAAIIVHHPEAKYYAVRGDGTGEGVAPTATAAIGARTTDATGAAA
jgi:hypothetical protein